MGQRAPHHEATMAWGVGFVLVLLAVVPTRADTATAALNMSAQITASCSINVPAQLSFGSYDVSAATPRDVASNISVTCSVGSAVYITIGQGTFPAPGSTDAAPIRRMSAGGSDRLRYDIYRDAARTALWGNTPTTAVALTGDGTTTTVTVYGRIPPGQPVLSGAYQDVALATVYY